MGCSSSKASSLSKSTLPRRFPSYKDKHPRELSKIDSQGRFMRQVVDKGVIGRCEVLEQIHEYINSDGTCGPLVVVGEDGLGKTAVMAAAALTAREQARRGEIDCGDYLDWEVFYHFVKAMPDSRHFQQMLPKLLREIGFCNDLDLAVSSEEVARMCICALSSPSTPPVAIFVDGIHEFCDSNEALDLVWLPEELVPQVKVVISVTPGSRPHKALHTRNMTNVQEISLLPLDTDAAQSVIENICNKLNMQLSQEELSGLLGFHEMGNPLWLRVALHLASRREDHTDRVSALPEDMSLLLCETMECMEDEYGSKEVGAVLSLIQVSHMGMLEEEISALLPLKLDPNSGDPSITCESARSKRDYSRLFDGLRLFIHPHNHTKRLQFMNTSVSNVVCKKYLISIESSRHQDLHSQPRVQWWHKLLAAYFESHSDLQRRAEEYPYHLCKLGWFDELARALTDWDIFDFLFDRNHSSKLLYYWHVIGESEKFIDSYRTAFSKLQEHNFEIFLERAESCAILSKQAGHYDFALEIIDQLLQHQSEAAFMASIYSLRGDIYTEKIKQSYISGDVPINLIEDGIYSYEEAISIRKKFRGGDQKVLAKDFSNYLSLLKDSEDQFAKASMQVEAALHFFNELEETGYYIEALLAKAVIHKGRPNELQIYLNAEKKCLELFGENHQVMNKLYQNISIFYEDEHHFEQAYQYLKKWYRSCLSLYGPEHTLTRRAAGTLQEQTYLLIEQRLQKLAASSGKLNGHHR